MSTTKQNHHVSTPTVAAPVTVDPIPAVGAPNPPAGAVLNVKHPKLNQRMLNAASTAADEVHTFTAYVDFGVTAPPQTAAAAALTTLGLWRAQERAAANWHAYTRAQLVSAAAHASAVVGPLEAPFDALVAHRPELAPSFRGLATYFKADSEAAKKGAVTRKVHRTKGKGATAPASTVATAPASTVVATAPALVVPAGGARTSG